MHAAGLSKTACAAVLIVNTVMVTTLQPAARPAHQVRRSLADAHGRCAAPRRRFRREPVDLGSGRLCRDSGGADGGPMRGAAGRCATAALDLCCRWGSSVEPVLLLAAGGEQLAL